MDISVGREVKLLSFILKFSSQTLMESMNHEPCPSGATRVYSIWLNSMKSSQLNFHKWIRKYSSNESLTRVESTGASSLLHSGVFDMRSLNSTGVINGKLSPSWPDGLRRNDDFPLLMYSAAAAAPREYYGEKRAGCEGGEERRGRDAPC